tara:strand:- start:59 stop:397 length:339 start_codon:yes stop_codon:yes gene_type:complete
MSQTVENMNVNQTETIETTTESINKEVTTEKKKKKKKKNKCCFSGCNNNFSLSIGHCKWCSTEDKSMDFCTYHRLPEQHNCPNIKDCKAFAININKDKLNKQKSIDNRVSVI